ncbi:hypothetical protein WICANDRAFT_86079 [Wickerhamomyces anomalus NRRL Y-366-8]|uniref:Major facilitator superfamily (MFS) profile domain-containing protein n=1 Tax=Wickerhamomyces anomalus (strain ATCC 58044 / CBS 1984 / NCYC 433 / NRRL Y-366-8) TaxID=683960 RepID=A0A1E3NVZ8_WICAA|nr:uncharacterized protein WICANDRAFT_86079 [Wickerhamomyces anomalus NRRL Y-366-8]ODQ57170.1 hypothetical protein WICANDRAFT_86079 [Wickerhamomyces anomalus NRRL Y-366-8]
MLVISLAATNSGYDGSLLNAFQAMPAWMSAMSNPSGPVLGAMSNGTTLGSLLCVPIASTVGDQLGRRHSITLGNIIMLMGVIVQSCSGTWLHIDTQDMNTDKRTYAMTLVGRLIIGFGSSLVGVSAPPLVAELSYPSHRQAVTAFYNSNWYLGAIISGWVSFGTRNIKSNWSWRIPTIIQGLFPLLQIFLIYFVPDSPRFLVNKGKIEEARRILLKYHANNDEKIGGPLVDFEMSEIQSAIEQEKIANKTSYLDFLRTPGNRKRLFLSCYIGIIAQLSGNGLVSYYMNKVLNSIGITSTSQQLVFNGGLMIYNYGISIIINLSMFQKGKRRMVFLTSLSLMLIFYIIWTILSAINQKRNFEDKSLGKGVMAMIFMYYLAYNLGLNGLPILYLTEYAPFTLRTKAMNICQFCQMVVLIYNGFVNPIAMDAIEWKYYIVFCCIIAVELVVGYLTLVETAGRSLEEVAEVFGESIGDIDYGLLRHTTKDQKPGISHIEDADQNEAASNTSSADKSVNVTP